MTINRLLFLGFCFIGMSCSGQKQVVLTNDLATIETKNLYKNLRLVTTKGILFGHQDDLAYGVNWKYQKERSDIKEVTGDYPAVYGWDIAGLERKAKNNIDGVPFDTMKEFIKQVYDRGGINTISWHMDNPLTGKNAWDTTPNSFASIMPNGEKHKLYLAWLDEGAKFLNALKGSDGKKIPILFRPFHELTGNWFWWCKNNSTPEQFKEVWKFTIDYLQKVKKVNNLIIVYNTADFSTKEEFLEYYPGDQYADVLSFDKYQYNNPLEDNSFVANCQNQFKIMDEVAKEHNKIMAFAETGYEQIPYNKWWTKTLQNAIGNYKIAYVLVWRNHGWQEHEKKMHYYAPFKGHPNEKDFIEYYNLESTFFQKDATQFNLYK